MTIVPMTTIIPLKPIEPLEQLRSSREVAPSQQEGGGSFADLLKKAINDVNETDAIAKQDIERLVAGEIDDLHTIQINAVKAELALDTVVQIRNKALDAYTEIMRITL